MRRAHCVSLLQMTDHTNDNAFDVEGVALFQNDGLHCIIGGLEFYGAAFPLIRLDRGFAIHQGNDGLTITGGRLLLHDDERIRHRFA